MKTQKSNQMTLVDSEESKSFKKQRMLEVRAAVAHALKHNKRVDEMGFTGTDIPRAMIALQDEVMKTRERHHKATKHISVARRQVSNIFPMVTTVIAGQTAALMDMAEELQIRDKMLADTANQAQILDNELQHARAAIRELR